MSDFTRREFMEIGARLAAVMGLGVAAIPDLANAAEAISAGQAPVLWMQGQNCTGCSVSLLNCEMPGIAKVITQLISLKFHSNISAATGDLAMDVIEGTIKAGGYTLVVEGSIPVGMPSACMIGHEPISTQVVRAAKNAGAVLAVGTCASFGGIPAAENNPTGAIDVVTHLKNEGVTTPVIRLPGCPAHPDWLIGTIVHVLKFGLPEMDELGRPTMFYGKLVHDQCPRFADYEREKFAHNFGEDGCLFKLGCLGTNTKADCTKRLWNSGTNSCINAGSPCIGCAWEGFAADADLAFYRITEHQLKREAKN
jgi:hydrogenase small subunit